MKLSLAIKRAYETPEPSDGRRILVDRMWPRGLAKANAGIDEWVKEVAPSTELRQWFGHDPAKWEEFQRRYTEELEENKRAWEPILQQSKHEKVTLIFSAHDPKHNNAEALLRYLQSKGKHAQRDKSKEGAEP